MDNSSPIQSFTLVPVSNAGSHKISINSLPTEIVSNIIYFLNIEPDATRRDKRRRQSMLLLCPVSRKLCAAAMSSLYEVIYIPNINTLQLFWRSVSSQPQLGRLVRELYVNLRICWDRISEELKPALCGQLYGLLNSTPRLQLLSLDLEECEDCFRNSSPEEIAANGANAGYDTFFELVADRIRTELKVRERSRTFLPGVKEFHFTSTDIPHTYCAFFALPSLERIVSVRDTGAWSLLLDPEFDIGIHNPHIKELSLRSTALVPSEVCIIAKSFPNLVVFTARNNTLETNRQFDPNAINEARLAWHNLSIALASLRHLQVLLLQLDYPKALALPQINFPVHLGPAGGITGLGGLYNLTDLQIGMHHLMHYRGKDSMPMAEPLPPTLLPPALRRLRLYTCLSCWNNSIAGLSRDPSLGQIKPSYAGESTFRFVASLAAHVAAGAGLPQLRDVRIYSQTGWWLAYGVDYRTVRHCAKEEGQVWNAGGFEECCGISRLENRPPGIHFRAYETDELDCGRDHPDDNY